MPKQSTRFYRKNESEVMKSLGLNPTSNSGAGWIDKADGKNDYIICELKSTERASIGVKFADIAKLQEQAAVAGKIPVFAIQDLTNNETFVIIKPDHLEEVAKYLKTGKHDLSAVSDSDVIAYQEGEITYPVKRKISAPSEKDRNANRYQRKEQKAYE